MTGVSILMILLDSSYLIGLIVDNDKHHKKSHELRPLLTHEKKDDK